MKKNIVSALIFTGIVMASVSLAGCSKPAEDAADYVEDVSEQKDKAQDALDDFNALNGQQDEQAEQVLDSLKSGNNSTLTTLSKGGYAFTYDGVAMTPDMDFAPVLESLGEPQHYYEVKSCAFEGMDKIYTYPSFEITTYPDGNIDRISYINFKDDTITTDEGVYLSMSKDKVIGVYGEGYTDDAGIIVYEKGGMELKFIFANDSLKSIEYATEALKDK